jgi:hypothetical protein
MAKAKEEQSLAKATPAGEIQQAETPSFLQEFKGQRMGSEDMERNDITLPRLALCQSLTPQKKKTNPNYIPELEDGMFFNTVTGEIYGESLEVVPLFFGKSRIFFEDINKGGGMKCQSLNAKNGGKLHPDSCESCPHAQWEENKPTCGLYYNYVSLVYPRMELIVVSMKSTALKVARSWNSMIRLTNLPMFAKVYNISSAEETKNQNTYSQFKIAPKKYVDQEFFAAAKTFFEDLHEKNIEVDTTGLGGEAGPIIEGDTDFKTSEL